MNRLTHETEIEAQEDDFKPLTAKEAFELRRKMVQVSLWQVLIWQLLVGVLMAFAAWFLTGQISAAWSAIYGAIAVVFPAALFAKGVHRFMNVNATSAQMSAALLYLFVWELLKIVLTIVLLLAAPKLITDLNWFALLFSVIVTLKIYGFALWMQSQSNKQHV